MKYSKKIDLDRSGTEVSSFLRWEHLEILKRRLNENYISKRRQKNILYQGFFTTQIIFVI